jgi:hypothetical protein
MSSIRSFVSAAASTIGPDAKTTSSNRTAEPSRISVSSVKEEHIVISQLDQVLFETFGKDSPVIPAGCIEIRNAPVSLIEYGLFNEVLMFGMAL